MLHTVKVCQIIQLSSQETLQAGLTYFAVVVVNEFFVLPPKEISTGGSAAKN